MMGASGQMFPIVGRLQRVKQADGDRHDSAMAEDPLEIGHARFAAVPADDIGMLAIINRCRAYLHIGRRGGDRFQQCRPERQQLAPAACGPFREDGQRLMVLQCIGHPANLAMGVPASCPVDVQSAVLIRDPAQQRRSFKFRLGNEGRPGPAAKDQYVEPAGVIGDDKCVRLERRTLDARADAGDQCCMLQETPGPARPRSRCCAGGSKRSTRRSAPTEASSPPAGTSPSPKR